MCLTTRCKCSQIKYEERTNKITNLHQIHIDPVLSKQKEKQAEKRSDVRKRMDNAWRKTSSAER